MGHATGKNNKQLGALELMKGLGGTLVSGARGLVGATAGLPGDVESILRMLTPGVSDESMLPNTDDMLQKHLPQLPVKLQQPIAEKLGSFGVITPGQIARGARAVKTGALALMDRAMANSVPMSIRQAGAIRPRSSNMIQEGRGSANNAMKDWYRGKNMTAEDREKLLRNMVDRHGVPEEEMLKNFANADAHDAWVDSILKNYIKRDLATPNDIVRQLFDQGIYHINPDDIARTAGHNFAGLAKSQREWLPEYAGADKASIGQFAKTSAGRLWEDAADSEFYALPANTWERIMREKNPWLDKLDGDSLVYGLDRGLKAGMGEVPLGFEELSNMVSQALADGVLTPEKLKQFSMEKAIRMANEQRIAKEAEALAKQKAMSEYNGIQGVLHKEYPDQGFKWVEIKKPEKLDDYARSFIKKNEEGWYTPYAVDGNPITLQIPGSSNKIPVSEPTEELAHLGGMLANEGNAMGHCVGGYCNEVANGSKRIFSLRDAKGEPHVTIETIPQGVRNLDDLIAFSKAEDEHQATLGLHDMDFADWFGARYPELAQRVGANEADDAYELEELFGKDYNKWREYLSNRPEILEQVKGKANSRPDEVYQPFITDFIKSGNWDSLNDKGYHDIIDPYEYKHFFGQQHSMLYGDGEGAFKDVQFIAPEGYVTRQELTDHLIGQKPEGINEDFWNGFIRTLPSRFKDGGLVEADDWFDNFMHHGAE